MFVWLWSTIGTFALGLFLVVRGWRGRRRGGEPHCRKCDYNLTMLDSERCPECGTKLGRRTIVYGPRRRSWTFIAIGGLVLMLGLLSSQSTLLKLQARRHHFFPFRLLVDRAESGDERAMIELEHRIREKRLSESQAHRLADRALVMAGTTPLRLDPWWLRLVELDEADLLLDDHRKQIAAFAGSVSMSPRSVIRQNDPLVAVLSIGPGSSSQYVQRFEATEVRIGDRIVYALGGRSNGLLVVRPKPENLRTASDEYEYILHSADLPTGTTKLVIEGVSHFRASWETPATENRSRSKQERLEASITVVPLDDSDPVTWDERPELEATFQQKLRLFVTRCREDNPCNLRVVPYGPIERQGTFYQIPFSTCFQYGSTVPFPIAMEVIVEAGGRELPVKSVHDRESGYSSPYGFVRPAGSWWGSDCGIARVPVFDEDEFYIILRSNKDLARRTLNMYSVWHGELRYGPFPVRHDVVDGSP